MKKFLVTVSLLLILILIILGTKISLRYRKIQAFDPKENFLLYKEDMESLAYRLYKQNELFSVRRHESIIGSKLIYGFKINNEDFNSNINVTYDVAMEDKFWESDMRTIVSTKETGQITLEEFINLAEIDKGSLEYFISKLKQLGIKSISKSIDGKYIRMYISNSRGYLYIVDPEESGPVYARGIKLNDRWEYFTE